MFLKTKMSALSSVIYDLDCLSQKGMYDVSIILSDFWWPNQGLVWEDSSECMHGLWWWRVFQGCIKLLGFSSVQFSSIPQSCPTLCDPMNCSTPGLPVHHQLPEFTQTHIHLVRDAIQPSHPPLSPFPPAPNPSQHQSLFQWVNSSHEVAKVLEFQLQHQSFQRTPRADL